VAQRIRTIKPEFFMHEGLAELSAAHRLLFIGLWTLADRRGRLLDRPRRIKVACFPYDEEITAVTVSQMLSDLCQHPDGFLVRYSCGGKHLIEIPGFLEHQRPHHKEVDSSLPGSSGKGVNITESCIPAQTRINEIDDDSMNDSSMGHARPVLARGREGKGKEGNGKEGKGMEGNNVSITEAPEKVMALRSHEN